MEEEVILWSINFFISEFSSSIRTTRTTDEQFTFIFRVKVNQDITVHETFLQGERTSQTCFFIHSKQTFQWSMFNIIRSQYRQLGSHTDTIVSTQSSTLCLQPFTIDVCFNRIVQEIMI